MKKRLSLMCLLLVLVTIFAISFTACKNEPETLETLKNDYGVIVNGGGFTEGSALVSKEIVATTEEAEEVLSAIADQNYNKDGSVYIFDIYVTQDGKEVQPDGKVKVSIPVPDVEVDNYLVFHVKSDNSVESLVPTVADGKISFETSSFSYFVIAEAAPAEHEHNYESSVTPPTCTQDGYTTYTCVCGDSYVGDTVTAPGHTYVDGKCECGADDPNYTPPHVHSYEWVEGKASTCKEEGIAPHYHCEGCGKNFDENKGEIASAALPIGSHEYGSMYWGKSANFWEDGNIEYYQCSECEKYFDNEYNEIETPVIPKYSTNLSICVNGTPTALTLDEQNENFIGWSLEGLSVAKGDVITLCQTDNAEISHNYFADGNVGTDGKILTTAAAANVVLTATPNGLMLFIDGYKYEGIVIEINGEQYPMNFVTYPDGEETSYVYGYVEFAVGDKFVIVDNVSGTVYDYDDLDEAFYWNTWDYHRGDDGEFVIDFSARYGIEFDNNGNKKIYISKAFAPYDGESFGVVFEGEREDEIFDSMELPTGDGADNEFMWTLTHCTTMNNADFVEYIGENGLWFYYTIIDIEEGEKFSLKNFTTGELIGADYLVDITGDFTAVTREGDLVSVEKSGSLYIIYLPAFNSFTIECDTSDPLAEINLYAGDKAATLIPDENGDIFYEGFESKTYHLIAIDDARYSPLPIILDESMDKTLVDITVSGDTYYAYPTKEGIYNLRYNVYTNVLYLELVKGVEGGEEEDTITYFYWLGTESDEILMEQDATNENLYVASGVTVNANSYLMVGVYDNLGNETICTALVQTDSSIATSDEEKVTVYLAGTYTVYFDITARTIKIVRTGDVPEQSATVPKDIYIRYDNILTLIENSDNPDELCYLGLEMGAFESFKFRDTDRNYITNIKLAEGTTGASTNGTEIAFQVDGTFNIYISKTTHVVRIVSTSSGGEDVGGDVDYSEGVYLFLDDFILLYPDEAGNVTYNDFTVDGETSIAILDKSYNYLHLTLDASVSSSVAQIYSGNMLFFYKNGTANMTYNVNTGVIFVEMASTSLAGAKVYLYYSGNNTNATADENGKVTFENIVFTERGTIMLTDSAFEYLSMTLDPGVDSTLASVTDYGGIPTLIVNSVGTYKIHYDLATGIILLEVVDEAEPDSHEHSYASVVTPPTCTEDGYTTYSCACGESYVDDTVTAAGHSYSDGVCSACGAADPDYVPDLEPTPDGTVIDVVEILGVKTPMAGEHPITDGVYALQEGVEIVSVDWGYEGWDSTGEYTTIWMTASDVFDEEMYSSLVRIRIRALDGYYFNYFPDDEYYDMWVTLNGGSDTFQKDLTDDPYHVVDIYANLIMNSQTINVVEVYGLDRPVSGKAPDYEAILAGEGYTISGMYWYENIYDDEGSYIESVLMDEDDVFVEGHNYGVEIVFVADEGREFATYDEYLAVQVRINSEGVDAFFVDESDIAKGIYGAAGYDCYSEE